MPDIAFPAPIKKFHLSLLTSSLLLAAAPSFAETAAEDAKLDTVTVISTGLRGQQRTVADSPAPIDVINSDQLLKTGRTELSEAIAKLLPSFNFGTNIAGYNSVTRPLSNRSLGQIGRAHV